VRADDPLAAAALAADVERLCAPDLAGRGSYQPGGVAAAGYIERELRAAGLEVARQPVAGSAETVIGILRGGERAVIVSAHYDHLGADATGTVYPGADDNASGAAILLALARAASKRRFEHTVLFIAFGAEEDGLAGSRVYVAEPRWALDRTLAVINFDMVGRNFFESGADQPGAAAVVGLDEIPGAGDAARRAAREAGLKLIPVPARLLELFGFHDRTDDWWFRRRGVAAVHFSTGLHPDYHRPSDTPDKLVHAQMERVARTAHGLLVFLARPTR
jgi:Zn-dependent M28 family amino/carboxypeptidase